MASEEIPHDGDAVSRAAARRLYHADVEHSRELNRRKRAANPEMYAAITKRYREANADTVRAGQAAWRTKNADKLKAQRAEYRRKNKDKIRERQAIYRAENHAAIRERERVNRLRRLAENPELVERQRNSVRRYHAENPDRCREIRRNRKARIRGAEGKHTATDVAEILALQVGKCAHPWCRVKLGKKYEVDHIVAIARGGTNDRRNLQILCRPCNAKKWAKDAIDVARENGLLI